MLGSGIATAAVNPVSCREHRAPGTTRQLGAHRAASGPPDPRPHAGTDQLCEAALDPVAAKFGPDRVRPGRRRRRREGSGGGCPRPGSAPGARSTAACSVLPRGIATASPILHSSPWEPRGLPFGRKRSIPAERPPVCWLNGTDLSANLETEACFSHAKETFETKIPRFAK